MVIFAIELMSNVVSELLINLLSNAACPGNNLIINELDALVQILGLLTLTSQCSQFGVQSSKFRCNSPLFLGRIIIISLLHLQLMQLLPPSLVLPSEIIDLTLIVTYCH